MVTDHYNYSKWYQAKGRTGLYLQPPPLQRVLSRPAYRTDSESQCPLLNPKSADLKLKPVLHRHESGNL